MAVPLATRVVRYVATAGQTTFPYGWLALAATDFLVQRTRSGVNINGIAGAAHRDLFLEVSGVWRERATRKW